MATDPAARRRHIFISHASANLAIAREVEAALERAGHEVWLDDSDIRVGLLLRKELQDAIAASDLVVLLWSKPAAASRWISAEILTAFHLGRFIIPCVVSGVDLPQFLSRSLFCDLRRSRATTLAKLGVQAKRAPRAPNEFPATMPYQSAELKDTISRIYASQEAIVNAPDTKSALRLLRAANGQMRAAEKKYPFDRDILNLAGYHRKNAYMYKHWDAYAAGRFPEDPLLGEAERFFYQTLFINPVDPGALNGLGNILLFEGELPAALFFVERAIECATRMGIAYPAAEHDRRLILYRMGAGASHAAPGE